MITKKYLFVIFLSFYFTNLFAEEVPRKIIILEENLELEKNDIDQSEKKSKAENEANSNEVISNTVSKENKNLILN